MNHLVRVGYGSTDPATTARSPKDLEVRSSIEKMPDLDDGELLKHVLERWSKGFLLTGFRILVWQVLYINK